MNKKSLLNRTAAASAAVLVPLAVLTVPVVSHAAHVPSALAADTVPTDDLTDDGTQPAPPPPADPGPPGFDDLTDDGTQPAPPPPAEPGPPVPDDLTNENAPPTGPGPGPGPGPGNPPGPTGNPPAPPGGTPPAGTPAPPKPRPGSPRARRASLSLKVASHITRRRLRHGLVVRLTGKTAPVTVLVTLRGPGGIRIRRHLTLQPGTRKLTLRPHLPRRARGRKLTLVVTGTAADGTRFKLRRTIHVRGH